MNRIALSVALPLCIAAFAGAARAAETTIDVSVTIPATCVFRGTPAALAFGSVDPTSTTPFVARSEISYSCTKGATVGFSGPGTTSETAGAPATRNRTLTRDGGTETLDYVVSWTQPATTGAGHSTGNIVRVPLTATLAPAAFQDAFAGDYRDTGLKFTITP